MCVCVCAHAQTDTIRYVRVDGAYNNDGLSWANAKDRLQDAINDLHDYLVANDLTSGSVYVAAGTYIPTESTEATGGSMLNTSFKIYAGIHVYGGFNPDSLESKPGDRIMSNGKKCSENWADPSGIGTTSGTEIACQWDLRHKTVLTGNHTTTPPTFTFDPARGRYNTAFPASSFHVVWFATNGVFETNKDSISGHYRPLEYPASVNGCVISSGNASSRNTTFREHTGYGGGVYMVANSELRNCIVERCNANLGGGGIYLDGGGVVKFCYVHTCQSAGVGVVEGYGGGVYMEYDGQVGHSHITNCAARIGGGLTISHVPEAYPIQLRINARILEADTARISYYSPFAVACVINNNTASAEGGGVYLAEGGTINHCTVTANNCIGPDVTYYGRRHGRTGGIYIRSCGMIFNSVFWGNKCETNNDIQFASVRQKVDQEHEIYVYHTAFMNHDISDWTGVQKEMVFSLDKQNMPVAGSGTNYPCFFRPTVYPLDWDSVNVSGNTNIWGAGVIPTQRPAVDIPGPRIWHLTSYSALDQKGVQVTDAVQDVSEWIRHAHTDYGVVTNPYEPVSTLGALVRKPDALSYALIAPQGTEGRIALAVNPDSVIPTIFIDPNRNGVYDSIGNFVPQDKEGNSWVTPIKDIGEAVQFFHQYLVDDDGGNHHYMIPALDTAGFASGTPTRYDYVQILVKEGTITTAGPGNYLDRNIRTAAIRVDSHMRLYGGYPTKLTGTDTSERNPRDYVSNITSNITGIGGLRGYENNSAHVIAMINVEHAIIDGFTLSDANTHNVILSNMEVAGGGVLINNGTTEVSKRIHMTGNQLRNCVITNCTSPKGAAVYVNGEYPNSEGYICYAELKMVNCVVRNNLADYEENGSNIDDHGIITANGRAYVEMEHCDIVNNVGYPFKADSKRTASDEPITCTHPEHGGHGFHGYIRVNNSIIFCNGDRPLDNRGQLGTTAEVMSVFPDGQEYVFGEYNMFDADLRLQKIDVLQPHGFFNPDFTYSVPSDFVPDIPGNTTFGASLLAPLPEDKHNQAKFTRTNSSDPSYPTFVNPSRNVGNSPSGDKPLYGGTVSYAPLTTNPCVNAAGSNYADVENYDRTDNTLRDRGGTPDIGAIENTDLPAAGTIIYVTPDGAGKRDGSSWSNAIEGNAVYRLFGAGPAAGDSIDAANNARLVNATSGEPVLTTDSRYQDGFAQSYFTQYKTRGTTTTVTRTWTTETIHYVDGTRDGETETIQDNVLRYDSVTTGSSSFVSVPGFEAGWAEDPRYPYGEISGNSRSFWRATGNLSPYSDDGVWADSIPAAQRNKDTIPKHLEWLQIKNDRRENYVSGLQWAVEEASRRNHVATRTRAEAFDTLVQVWVGAGKYTDYKGFIMRDSVTVMGGFPTKKYSAPGLSERHALLSAVVPIPQEADTSYHSVDYETILQISDTVPRLTDSTFNTNAVRAWDNDLKLYSTTDTKSYAYKNRNIVRYKRYEETTDTIDVTSDYMVMPNIDSIPVPAEPDSISNGIAYFSFGTASATKDCWHLTLPIAGLDTANGVLRWYDSDHAWNGTKWKDVKASISDYEALKIYTTTNGTTWKDSKATTTVYHLWLRDLPWANARFWQTMKDVPKGNYRLKVDMSAFYRQMTSLTNTGVLFSVINAQGDTVAKQVVYHPTRRQVRHYEFVFDQPETGSLQLLLSMDDATATGSTCNRREINLADISLITYITHDTYKEYDSSDVTTDKEVAAPLPPVVSTKDSSAVYKSRTPIRKRVLTMPDICTPTYFVIPGNPKGETGDAVAHSVRVTTGDLKSRGTNTLYRDSNYVAYNEVYWDGFTIRHGFLYDISTGHGGGSGVAMFEGTHLQNCIVTDNISASHKQKGGGVFCEGTTATIENCFILNNSVTHGSTVGNRKQEFAGGLFLYEGTCFNSLIANNYSYGYGNVGLCVGRFYNNTVAYNTATNPIAADKDKQTGLSTYPADDGKTVGGVRMAVNAGNELLMANTIIYGNSGLAVDITRGSDPVAPFINCYVQSTDSMTKTNFLHALNTHEDGVDDQNYGTENVFLNGDTVGAGNTPFAADVVDSVYTAGAKANNDFALRSVSGINCVNHGTEEFEAAMETCLNTPNNGISNALKTQFRNAVRGVELPKNDVVYAARVQDCQVDIGAYEFNAAFSIQPDTTTHPGHAIFYGSYVSPGGDASAKSPHDAACLQKLQLVLDAAGRYKYKLMTSAYYNKGDSIVAGDTVGVKKFISDQPNKHWKVEVRLEGDNSNCTTSSEYNEWYTPTRSIKHSDATYQDNPLDYSFIVPHGIYLMGGYTHAFYHYENANGDSVAAGTPGAHIVDERDPLSYRSVLSGKITSNTGAEGNCFHVVTFTNDLFDENEIKKGEGGQLAAFSALPDAEKHRAVLDGLFIEDGYANAPDDEDRCGGAAIVTGYAHIRNCVVQNNEADEYGGGLYLKPMALVSGTIIKKNTAEVGGGVYFEKPVSEDVDSLAHVFTTTICQNTAHATAGGMWFDNTFARVNSTALWHNTANDYANVSGNFSRTSADTDYPFNFCAVESRRLEGQSNIELSPRETEGVRWDVSDPFNTLMYYPIVMSSTLARAGMTYSEWRKTMAKFPTLDSMDIAGVCRMQWTVPDVKRGFAWTRDTVLVVKNNDFIEIGARALNKSFEIDVNAKYVMRRLYVMHTELLNSEAALALQNNPGHDDTSEMYRQLGSCIYNPFHRLGDALDYIIAVRRSNPDLYRNARFEIFLEKGTYYPYHNAYGEQDQVRANTFLIPEATTLVGGINSESGYNYGQEGYTDKFTNTIIGDGNDVQIPNTGYSIKYATSTTIRQSDDQHRKMHDYNLNSVIEPWEFDRQTILSGNAVSGEDYTHIYHVVTIHADSTKIGPQPLKFETDSSDYVDWTRGFKLLHNPINPDSVHLFNKECEESKHAREIIFDGVHITGGYANHIDEEDLAKHPYQGKTYFRGGGIFVDGNWTESFDEPNADIPNVTEPASYLIPIVVRNSQFTDNMAGNGGAIYSNGPIHVYNSHFTQNYSQGPMTKLDQRFIPWTAGGCIASNDYCGVVNCLFDNNEARRGLYPITISGDEYIPNADARQGFGGVLSIAEQSRLRAINCHFTRNKAVAYSAIYNFRPNNYYQRADSMQLSFNSLFWGNEVFDIDNLNQLEHVEAPLDSSVTIFNEKYKASRSGVFHYDAKEWDTYEKLFHEYDSLYLLHAALGDTFHTDVLTKLGELRTQGDKMEGLFFCSYRKGYGPSGMKPTQAGYLLTEGEHLNFTDPRKLPIQMQVSSTGSLEENFEHLFTRVHGNNNVLINRINTATDGPNFKQPSPIAGIDGYMQNADWLLARINHTTDQGWGHLKQIVGRATYYTATGSSEHYDTAEEALAAAQALNPSATKENDVVKHHGTPYATFDGVTEQDTMALFNFLARRAKKQSFTIPRIPIGDAYYMTYTRNGNEGETSSGTMLRISPNPRMNIEDVYIDLGIYEYQYVQLDIKGNEVDTMWVATKSKSDKQDGLTWETPTTDLQTAIDVLMSSHNNHDKYICFLGDEETSFAPSNVINDRRAFVITSNTLAPLLPDSAMADQDYGVKSLNFIGGYSFDVKDKPRDPASNPVVIEMPFAGNTTQLNQLFIVEDMTRQQVLANWMGETTKRDNVVIPITFDGITFINPYSTKSATLNNYELGGLMNDRGGAAIYYRWQRQYTSPYSSDIYTPNFNLALHPDSAMIDGRNQPLPKLTLSNCTFMDNGDREVAANKRSSAVRIEHGGGSSLIVNSLFHSNAGEPVHADRHDVMAEPNDLATVPNDVVIVNSTFALNDGHITLLSDNSEVHNSLIWLDDLAADTLTQLEINTDKWDKTDNKNKAGIANRVTGNAVWGCFQGDNEPYNNASLVTDNMNIFEGPYFTNPIVDATTSEERRERRFYLNPAVRTMNAADTTVYRNRVFFRQYPDVAETIYWSRANGFKKDTIVSLKQDYDLAHKPRLSGLGMERGAYECLAVLQRMLYVQPNLPTASAGDGSSWLSPFGQGQIQNAIDVAAVYNYLNSALDAESRRAYVFVKGSYGATGQADIIARDGVSVYGSIPGNFNDTAFVKDDHFSNEECQRYINYVRSITNGVASPDASTTQTFINSVSTIAGNYPLGFSIENFVITNPNKVLDESPISLDNDSVVIRNCLIVNNKVNGAPVVDLKGGLLYNSLLYNDSAESIIALGSRGLLLNNTIVNNYGEGVTNITTSDNSRVVNTISCQPNATCFAPYLAQKNPYTLPSYLLEDEVLNFQLHEHSTFINTGTESLPAAFTPYTAIGLVNFAVDRDILGNPRRIGGRVDVGAFETWRVEPGAAVEVSSLTNKIITKEQANISSVEEMRAAFTENYGGHSYPHHGSVVYLMDSSAMSMAYAENKDFDNIIFRPAYMLLKPGSSFYGNGHEVQMNYLAVEKHFINQRYSMTAFPYNYNVGNITSTTYNPATDGLTANLSPLAFNTYQYNGAARSAKDYNFQPNNSSLWQRVDTTNRTATFGYLMDFGSTVTDTVLRFTAFAPQGKYVYTETEAEADKIVYLQQYDHRTVSGSGIDFTRQEDMGWNMKGLPWLVTNYRTDTILEDGNFQRQMYIPHVFYQMDGDGEYLSAYDQIYSSRSWDRGAVMSMGNAFLTQTATQQAREPLYFHRPMYGFNEKASRPLIRMVRRTRMYMPQRNDLTTNDRQLMTSDYFIAMPDSTADKNVAYRYGRDGVKWQTDNAAVYLMDTKRQSRFSLLGSTPTEVDIPLGVKILEEDDYTFSLPEKNAFKDYEHVWFIDYAHNQYINLLNEDYTVSLPAGENTTRFALRIDGFPKVDKDGKRQYVVYAYQGVLYVRGIVEGDRITVYSPSGKLVHSSTATGTEFTMPLYDNTGFFIKVNDQSFKVVNI